MQEHPDAPGDDAGSPPEDEDSGSEEVRGTPPRQEPCWAATAAYASHESTMGPYVLYSSATLSICVQEDPESLLHAEGFMLTYQRATLGSADDQYNFFAVLALSALNGNSLPSCQRTTKVVQLLDCNLFWAAFSPSAGKRLVLQALLAAGGVTQQRAAAAFAQDGIDVEAASLSELRDALRPMAAVHFVRASLMQAAKKEAAEEPAAKRQRL